MSGYFTSEVKSIPTINQIVTKDGVYNAPLESQPPEPQASPPDYTVTDVEDGYYTVTTKDGTFKMSEGSNFTIKLDGETNSNIAPPIESTNSNSIPKYMYAVMFIVFIVFILLVMMFTKSQNKNYENTNYRR